MRYNVPSKLERVHCFNVGNATQQSLKRNLAAALISPFDFKNYSQPLKLKIYACATAYF